MSPRYIISSSERSGLFTSSRPILVSSPQGNSTPPHTHAHTYRKCLTHGFLTQHQCQIILFYPLKTFTEKFTARSYYSWLITCIFIKIEWNFLLKCHQNNIKWVGFYRFLRFHTIRLLYLKIECFTLLPLQVQILIFRFDQNFLAEFKVQLEIQAK